MSRYEQRLADDKEELRQRTAALGRSVADSVKASVEAMLAGDNERSYQLILDDLPINRESRSIDKACHAFVARHLPSAGHLRFVSSVMRMNVALERVGDYAVSIARQAVQLDERPAGSVAEDLEALAEQSSGMLKKALTAFASLDADLARDTKPLAKRVDKSHARVFRELTADSSRSLRDTAALLTTFNKLERVSDQAKNICEETLFELLGETKPPKRYNVLFVDADSSLLAPLARRLAERAFPESGRYASAGITPADALAPELTAHASALGIDVDQLAPAKLDASELDQFHVVVWLGAGTKVPIEDVPYDTVLLAWEVPSLDNTKDAEKALRATSQTLSAEIRELMVLMRGEDAC